MRRKLQRRRRARPGRWSLVGAPRWGDDGLVTELPTPRREVDTNGEPEAQPGPAAGPLDEALPDDPELPEADAVEQRRSVPIDDDEYRNG